MPNYKVGCWPTPKKIFVNGNEIVGVIEADTDKGFVRYYPLPPRTHKKRRDEVYTRKLRGNVTVEF